MFTVTAPLPHVIRYINPGILEATAIRGGAITLAEAADAFLSSPRAASPHTCRAYACAIDRLAAELGPQRPLAEVPGDEIAAALRRLWGNRAPATWNATGPPPCPGLNWCASRKRWPGPPRRSH